jgi:hypothetical protein
MLIAVVLVLLTVTGVAATVHAVHTDGYGARPRRGDRFADPRRFL